MRKVTAPLLSLAISISGCRGADLGGSERNWTVPVSGTVRDATGTTVPNAAVSVQLFDLRTTNGEVRGKCQNGHLLSPIGTESDGDGRFSVSIPGGGTDS